MPHPTKRLDDTLAVLRKPAARKLVEDRRPIYAAGLKSLGWTAIHDFAEESYWLFTKEGKKVRIWKGDAIEIAIDGNNFRPMPMKGRRNIAIAGQ